MRRPKRDRVAQEVRELFDEQQQEFNARATTVQRMACAGYFDNRKTNK